MSQTIASRYELRGALGDGAFGSVHAAWDALAQDHVAVKLIPVGDDPGELARVRREVSALRLLDLPGVVNLRDDGLVGDEDHSYYLVMDKVDGEPFPARDVPAPWSALRPLVARLLTTLGRVHAAGIMHRDLKPANVLVTGEDELVLVDFGVSGGPSMGRVITARGSWLGTPAYFAPEQIEGQTVDYRADLYAVGLMVYEALTGQLPHGEGALVDLVARRLVHPPPPAADVDPDIPRVVSNALKRLLATAPEDRPTDAYEALALFEDTPQTWARSRVRWLGSRAPIEAVMGGLRGGRSVAVLGATGSGRGRVMEEAAAALAAEGVRTTWLKAGSRPFESARHLAPDGLPDAELDAVAAEVERLVRAALAAGVVAVRRSGYLDRWTRELLARLREAGPLLTPIAELGVVHVRLGPLGEADLRPLFVGPDRLLHLQEDGARVVIARTHGHAAAVVGELEAWAHAGFAAWRPDGRLEVGRAALDRLSGDLRPTMSWHGWAAQVAAHGARDNGDGRAPRLDGEHAEVCQWIALTHGQVDAPTLARAMRRPAWEVEAVVRDLEGLGAVVRDTRGTFGLAAGLAVARTWSTVDRSRSHAAVADALDAGRARAAHLLAAGRLSDGARDAVAIAVERVEAGRLGEAVAAVDVGLVACRGVDDVAAEVALLEVFVRLACAEASVTRLDRVLYELARASVSTPRLGRLEQLARGACNICRTVGANPLSDLGALGAFEEAELERWRHAYRVRASRGASLDLAEGVLDEARAWAAAAGSARARALVWTWEGLHAYRVGDFGLAMARQGAAAASGALDEVTRIGALIDQASAAIEAGSLGLAGRVLEEALAAAAACRHPVLEARATWLARSLAYREGRDEEADLELAEASGHLGRASLEAVLCMTEASFAWRRGAGDAAARLAGRARRAFVRSNNAWAALLTEALEAAARGACAEADRVRLVSEAGRCPVPEMGLQVVGLVALGSGEARAEEEELAEALYAAVPAGRRGRRLDVLTAEEALGAARTEA